MLQIKSFAFNPFSENTYVLFNDKGEAFIVDPGNFSDEETSKLRKFISDSGLTVQNILLTHAHIDHVLGLQWAHDTYKVPVMLHEREKEILGRNPMDANRFGFSLKPFNGELKFLNENDVVALGDEKLKVFHVPGHSPGSVAYYSKESSLTVSGDVLFEGSIGRTDLYKGNHEQLIASVSEKLFTLADETTVFSGHGNPTTIGFEKQYNPFFR